MRRLVLDPRAIPTGGEEAFAGLDGPLGEPDFDDGFALLGERASFSLAGAGRRISVDLLEGYPCAQVFAPRREAYVALRRPCAQPPFFTAAAAFW